MGDPGDEPLDSLKKGEARAQRPGPERAPDYELPEVLRDGDPRVILNRLIDEDPFELSSRCARRVREEAVLLHTERLILSAMAVLPCRSLARPASRVAVAGDRDAAVQLGVAERVLVQLAPVQAAFTEKLLSRPTPTFGTLQGGTSLNFSRKEDRRSYG